MWKEYDYRTWIRVSDNAELTLASVSKRVLAKCFLMVRLKWYQEETEKRGD